MNVMMATISLTLNQLNANTAFFRRVFVGWESTICGKGKGTKIINKSIQDIRMYAKLPSSTGAMKRQSRGIEKRFCVASFQSRWNRCDRQSTWRRWWFVSPPPRRLSLRWEWLVISLVKWHYQYVYSSSPSDFLLLINKNGKVRRSVPSQYERSYLETKQRMFGPLPARVTYPIPSLLLDLFLHRLG